MLEKEMLIFFLFIMIGILIFILIHDWGYFVHPTLFQYLQYNDIVMFPYGIRNIINPYNNYSPCQASIGDYSVYSRWNIMGILDKLYQVSKKIEKEKTNYNKNKSKDRLLYLNQEYEYYKELLISNMDEAIRYDKKTALKHIKYAFTWYKNNNPFFLYQILQECTEDCATVFPKIQQERFCAFSKWEMDETFRIILNYLSLLSPSKYNEEIKEEIYNNFMANLEGEE